ncbi:MAG: hypothetical protein AB7K67_09525 [Hyphomicrobiaceae bacterium]
MRTAIGFLRPVGRAAVAVLRFGLQTLLAVILAFEEWGWRPLAAALAYLARWRVLAWIEGVIATLPPYAALLVFVLPSALVFPLKLLSLYLIANGRAAMAAGLFLVAKVVGTAVLARLFQLTQPALMQIPWFAALYRKFMPWKDALLAQVRASWAWRVGRLAKMRVHRLGQRAWARLREPVLRGINAARARLRVLLGPRRDADRHGDPAADK